MNFRLNCTERIKCFLSNGLFFCQFPIMSCCCGELHTVCLSQEEGNVYSFGRNTEGQLGQGHNSSLSIPNSIPNLPKIKRISCGLNFTVCIDNEGTMWSFGENDSGQLGTGNKQNYNFPQKITNLPPFSSVSCGNKHTILITINLELYSIGNNLYGQLFLEKKGSSELTAKKNKIYKYKTNSSR